MRGAEVGIRTGVGVPVGGTGLDVAVDVAVGGSGLGVAVGGSGVGVKVSEGSPVDVAVASDGVGSGGNAGWVDCTGVFVGAPAGSSG